jgi:uncharacterized protein (UPF0262 family)
MSGDGEGFRLVEIELDEASIQSRGPDVDHDRRVAIFDLLEENRFRPLQSPGGPYVLRLALEDGRLALEILTEGREPHGKFILSLTPFRRIVKDYFLVCDSYYSAIKTAPPGHIEAIDMGRRGLHNEGSELLRERLKDKIELDFDTARRLFTLICALHARDDSGRT